MPILRFFQSVLPCFEVAGWSSRIDLTYAKVEDGRRRNGIAAVAQLLPSGERFVPTSSSLTIGAIFSESDIRRIFAVLEAAEVLACAAKELGGRTACNLDQTWIRRQYAPGHYPSLHAPHGWHQDGALGFAFMSHPDGVFPSSALLPMMTCWIALGACGVDAPGLELVTEGIHHVLSPADLSDERVLPRFPPEQLWRPAMEAGDAVLFHGDILHRTHVTPAMTQDRTSIELRFFPANDIPGRLRGNRFVSVD